MSTTLTVSNFKCSVGWDYEQTQSSGFNTTNIGSFASSTSFTNGSGAGKAQGIYVGTLTVAGSAGTQTVTLDATSTDPLGVVMNLTKVKGIYISHNTPAATGTLTVGGNFFAGIVLTGTTPLLVLQPGMFAMLGGSPTTSDVSWAVTSSTHDTIVLTNNDSASVSVTLVVIGE